MLSSDSEIIDWLEKTNPIIFHKAFFDSYWELIPRATDFTRYTGATLREACLKAMEKYPC